MYTEIRNIDVELDSINKFFNEGSLEIGTKKMYANQYVIMKCQDKTALDRYDKKQNKIVSLIQSDTPV